MKKEHFLNRITFTDNRFNEYKRFCERIATSKTSCHPTPPPVYPFLEKRLKKREMTKERQEDIQYNLRLLNDKYKEMYRKNNKYHPNNIKFFPHPKSLRFSEHRQEIYEKTHQNLYLGNKLRIIKSAKSQYNSKSSLENYKYLRYIEGNIKYNSKYKNFFLDLVTPYTYEKRLHSLIASGDGSKRALSSMGFRKRTQSQNVGNEKWKSSNGVFGGKKKQKINIISIDREYVNKTGREERKENYFENNTDVF